MEKIVIVIPTYNEKENIGKIIEILKNEIFPKIYDYDMGILVVDDNSPDWTIDVVLEKAKKYKNLKISIGEKKGLGVVYKRGVDYCKNKLGADVIIKMDGDFTKVSSGFYYTTQIIYQVIKMGIRIAEVPINFELRKKGKTKTPFSNIPKTLITMIRLRLIGK